MAKTEKTPEDYDDQLSHLAQRPHDILIGWIVVGVLLLGIMLALQQEDPTREAEVRASAGTEAAALAQEMSVSLADQIGMSLDHAK